MDRLVDSAVWITLARSKTPRGVRERMLDIVSDPDICVCEPVLFELRRHSPVADADKLESILEVTPVLLTPVSLWRDATHLGADCRRGGLTVPPIDLLIAQTAIHHGAMLVTMDRHFLEIKKVAPLTVEFVDAISDGA